MTVIASSKPPSIHGLHHWAWRCRDAEETRRFYEDVLGLPLAHVIQADVVPSTGEYCPYVHLFFRLNDGSYVAFFDLGDDRASQASPNTPAWVNHLALKVGSVGELEGMKARLEAHGVEVIGIVDHGFVKSIYFFDPNGVRMEFTTEIASTAELESYGREARGLLDKWSSEKQGLRLKRALA